MLESGDANLERFPRLTRLNRAFLPLVDDTVVEHINRLRSLEDLDVTATAITDDGFQRLQVLSGLRELRILKANDASLHYLATKLAHLRCVCLEGTSVTEKTLEALQDLPELKWVNVFYTPIDKADIQRFQSNVKDAEVFHQSIGVDHWRRFQYLMLHPVHE